MVKKILYKLKRKLLLIQKHSKVLFSRTGLAKEYNFQKAKDYWHNVPQAQGATPWNTKKLKNISDDDLIEQFNKEQIKSRKKDERKLGFSLALKSINELKDPLIIDYGSGIGFYGFEILDKFQSAKVTFIDINKANLLIIDRIAKIKGYSKRVKTIQVEDERAEKLNLSEQYDFIISMGVLHHTPHAKKIVSNLTLFLKKDGIFQVMLYNKHFKKRLSIYKGYKISNSEFGELTDPEINNLKNPYSEDYDDKKTLRLFGDQYRMISKDYPTTDYNTYRFLKTK
tara:strand:- start:4424 stop:5272 length:849 start_codon:yes stop_codon:yes gene_type:complete